MASKIITVEGTAFYCMPNTQDTLSGKYTMKLGMLSDKMVKAFRSLNIPVKFDTKNEEGAADYMGYYVIPKSEVPVDVVDFEGNPLPPQVKIGNGSQVIAGIEIAPYTFQGRAGLKLKWLGLKVRELVKYDPDKAKREKAMTLLDGISGEGFVFGEETTANVDGNAVTSPNFDELFSDAQ
jgi:hypothetical protein